MKESGKFSALLNQSIARCTTTYNVCHSFLFARSENASAWPGLGVSGFDTATDPERLSKCSSMTCVFAKEVPRTAFSWSICCHWNARTKTDGQWPTPCSPRELFKPRFQTNHGRGTKQTAVPTGKRSERAYWAPRTLSSVRRTYKLNTPPWPPSGLRDTQMILVPCALDHLVLPSG